MQRVLGGAGDVRQTDAAPVADTMRQLWALCRGITDPAVVRSLEAMPEYRPVRAALSGYWAAHLRQEEEAASRRVLSDPLRTGLGDTSMLALEDYRGTAGELALLRGRPAVRAAVVGCGPYPETLMALQTSGLAQRAVVGVDRHAETVALATAMTDRFCAPEPHARIVYEDAAAVDYSDYDVVVVANGLVGKARLLDRIHRTAPIGVRVLMRSPVLMGRLFYEHVQPDLRPGWTVTGRHLGTPLSETLLLERGEHA